MYYGLFRIGELTQGDHPVLARDVHIAKNKKKIFFVLRSTKTLYKNMKLQLIKISSTKKKEPKTKRLQSNSDNRTSKLKDTPKGN